MADGTKTGWDKANILLPPLGALLTAFAVAFLGVYGSNTLSDAQGRDEMRRAYAELISQREAADTSLRREMFQSILDKFLRPQTGNTGTMDEKILQLELLAYNFHDSIDVSPLFKDIYRKIDVHTKAGQNYLHRLEKLTKEVSTAEVAALGKEGGATLTSAPIDFDDFAAPGQGIPIVNQKLGLHGLNCEHEKIVDYRCRKFTVVVMAVYPQTREVLVQLKIGPLGSDSGDPEVDTLVRVGFFDFPMIDNTTISHNQRCALVLNRFDNAGGLITLVLFPGFRTGQQDRVVVEEAIHDINRQHPGYETGE